MRRMLYAPSKRTQLRKESIRRGRLRIVNAARKLGGITKAQAGRVGRFRWPSYHLNMLAHAGLLRCVGRLWVPARPVKKNAG